MPHTNDMTIAKEVPFYDKGTEVVHCRPTGSIPARAIDVHFDDSLEPYYTLLAEDGAEKQTNVEHLFRPPHTTQTTMDAIESGFTLSAPHKCQEEDETNEDRPILALQKQESADGGSVTRKNYGSAERPAELPVRSLHSQTRYSTPASSDEVLERSRKSAEVSTREVQEFRCRDSCGHFGFYTGTVAALDTAYDVPHGRGEMVYDAGTIAKGVWSEGSLVPPSYEQYRPFRLPGYSIGDNCRNEDMTRATTEAVAALHVDDCAWIRRSDGPGKKGGWSYALVHSRTDGADAAMTFQVNHLGFTKTIAMEQWSCHVRLPALTLPGYLVGDAGRLEDMAVANERDTVVSVSKLRSNDAAFVARSNGLWVYALLIDRTTGKNAKIKFRINQKGSSKSIKISQCGRFVRCIKRKHWVEADDGAHPPLQGSSCTNSSRSQDKQATTDMGGTQKVPQQANEREQSPGTESPSSLEEQLPLIYKQLDQRYQEGSIGSTTFQSCYRQSCEEYYKSLSGQGVDQNGTYRDHAP